MVKRVEVVSEAQRVLPGLNVVVIGFDVVVARVPGHRTVISATGPIFPHRRPEVHIEKLIFILVRDTKGI